MKGRGLIGADETLLCGMCFVKELGDEPVVALACRHVYHMNCVMMRLTKKWAPSRRISFDFLNCPVCKREISLTKYQVPELNTLIISCLAEKDQKVK